MALMTKGDLYYKDYKWTAYQDDDPKVTGVPDSTLFNRHEGYEVLYFINKLAEKQEFKRKEPGLKIEKMIRNELPTDIRRQEDVASWIALNWNKSIY